MVDSRGPQIPLAGASVCSIPGYAGIKRMYDDGTGLGTSVSTAHFALLITCGFLTALGARAGIISAINATAKSFPESARATTTDLVLSGFGLRVLFFDHCTYFLSWRYVDFLTSPRSLHVYTNLLCNVCCTTNTPTSDMLGSGRRPDRKL
ncbi:hypothetical protein EDD17DRAFT_1594842 [Pisolithus thermaeus]|nr:hypothetical protein EDD17DRAFT_1594842 [Pisolithus thermaeus]